MKYKVVPTKDKGKPTYVPAEAHKLIKGVANIRDLNILEAYSLVITEGTKALGYDPDIILKGKRG